ncbi:MAG: PhzF family phenazine biosynthesis protein [Cyanobacteria bacterium P01_G01_bin.38]
MTMEIIQVDAFTDQPFKGNPAAVCVTDGPMDEGLMQSIAAEMNLSETAFLYPQADGYSLRWFTPAAEVDLCGHATLASAHVLWSEGHLAPDQTARFQTKSGLLTAQQKGDWIEMNFPPQPVHRTHVTPQLVAALCCHGNINQVLKNDTNFLVELQSEAAVHNLQPNFAKMKALPVHGIIVTAQAGSNKFGSNESGLGDCDFVSRYFAPAVGVDEDPVTGSAHASLGPYWQAKLGKTTLLAHQVSPRGGVLKVSYGESDSEDRVYISGQAVMVMRGTLAF